MLEFEAPQVKNVLVSLDEDRRAKNRAATSEELHELARVLLDRSNELGGPARGVRSAGTDDSTHERNEFDLLRSIVERERRRLGISSPTDGPG